MKNHITLFVLLLLTGCGCNADKVQSKTAEGDLQSEQSTTTNSSDQTEITEKERAFIGKICSIIKEKSSFDTLFEKWKKNYQTNSASVVSSSTLSAKELEEFTVLKAMGGSILPLIIEKLCNEDNFFALVLYDELQSDNELKVFGETYSEQSRSNRTVRKWIIKNKN